MKGSAPRWPVGRLVVDKAVRSTLDALGEAGLTHDDSQVAQVFATKAWTTGNGRGADRGERAVNRQELPTIGAVVLTGAFLGTCVALGMLAGGLAVAGWWRR